MNCKRVIWIVFLSLALMCGAETRHPQVAKLLAKYESVKTYRADFVQVNDYKDVRKITSKGSIYYKGSNILLEYSQPKGQYALVRQDSLTVYMPADKRAMVGTIRYNLIGLKPVDYVRHFSKDGAVRVLGIKEGVVTVEITPSADQMEDQIARLTFKMKETNATLIELTLLDLEGNTVRFTFTNEKLDGDIPVGKFQKKIPPGTDIIDNT